MNAGELTKMDPYEEVAQQGHAPPLSPIYVPDPMELDEHVPVYVLELEHLEYHVASDNDMQVEDQPYANDASLIVESPGHTADSDSMEEDSIGYPDKPEDDDKDPKEDSEKDHTDYPADGRDGDDEPSNDDDTDDEDEEPTEDEGDDDEEEEHLAPANSFVVHVIDHVPSARDTEAFKTDEAQKTVRLEPPMSASIEARIAEHVAAPIPPTSPTYDQAPLGHRAAMIRMQDDIPEEDMPPRRRFVLTAPPPGYDIAESSAASRPPREDVGYVRALHAFEHRMMTSIEEVNLRISYQAQVRMQESKIMPVTRHGTNVFMTPESIQAMIDQALQRNYTHAQDDGSQSSGGGLRRPVITPPKSQQRSGIPLWGATS
nr:hypothetical protein [Tanacetum cinerariifolium]